MAAKIEDEKVGIGDRINMLFSSSLITYGRGKAVVVDTGMDTEVGKIADIINTAEDTQTPLPFSSSHFFLSHLHYHNNI